MKVLERESEVVLVLVLVKVLVKELEMVLD